MARPAGKSVCARRAGRFALGRVSWWVELSHPAGHPPTVPQVSCSKYVPAGARWESPKPRRKVGEVHAQNSRPGRSRWSACAWAPCRRRRTSRRSRPSATAVQPGPTGPPPSVWCGLSPAPRPEGRTRGKRRGRWIARPQMRAAVQGGRPPPPLAALGPPPSTVLQDVQRRRLQSFSSKTRCCFPPWMNHWFGQGKVQLKF